VETTGPWLVQCMLLVLAWIAIAMWRTVRPPTFLLVVALVPVLLASALVVIDRLAPGTERDQIINWYACVLAVVVPFAIMMRHQVARLIKAMLPTARLVRRRRR
jgi:hypothetical protein